MTAIQKIIGLSINKIEEVHDYVSIEFSDGTTLNIFNNYIYDAGSVLCIVGKEVESVEESGECLLIFFDDSSSVSIGLLEDDYNGPEAIVLRPEGKLPIVWN